MTKARDLANIISGGFTADDIPNIDASKITSGTFADARLSQSSVQQYASTFDDNKIVNDISTLALRQASDANRSSYNTNSQSVDVFQDNTGIDTTSNVLRDNNEYVSSASLSDQSLTIDSSNYTTYVDSIQGRQINNSTHNIYEFTNWSLSDNTSLSGSWGTKGANIFANNNNNTDWQVNNNVGHTPSSYYFHAIGIKLNTSAMNGSGLAVRDFGLTWRTGAGNYWWTIMEGANSDSGITAFDDVWSLGGCRLKSGDGGISNGSSYSHSSTGSNNFANNTQKASHLWIRQFHYSGAATYMYNNLSITGLASLSSVNTTGNFTGTTITAPSSVSEMGAIITYQDNAGTNALNTDIVLQLSADGGSNYSTATLTALPDFSTGIKMAKVNDLAVTAGTQLKYKISFANQASGTKEARIRGVALQY
jgi:hypothetical protein